MSSVAAIPPPINTLADLQDRLGGDPLNRIRVCPYPAPVPRLAPNLAVEVLSRSNTPREMMLKRQDYFSVGVELVWEVDPVARTVAVYTSATEVTTLTTSDSLDGGVVLPGFSLHLPEL